VPATLPLLAILDNLLCWQQDPSHEREVRVAEAMAAAAATVGSMGGSLEIDTIGTERLAITWGDRAADAPVEAETVTLHADDGTTPVARLRLDGPTANVAPLLRGVELAVQAVWSREDMRRNAERLEALDAATRAIAGVLSVELVLQLIVDRVRELIGAQYAALGIVDHHGVMERFVTSGLTREQRERIGSPPRGLGLLGLIVRENRSYRIDDISHHPDSSGFPPNHPPMTSFLGVPIRVMGRSVGNFYLTNKRTVGEFSPADQRLVEMFALHAGIAIENARLHEQVQRMAVVDERSRIGKDLHDGIIQALYGVGLSLEDVPDLMRDDPGEAERRVDRAIDSINGTIRDLRNFIFGLRPELVEQGDLVAGVGALVNELRLNAVIDVDLRVVGDVPALSAARRTEVIQIAREALSNVARHSKATRVSVEVSADDALLVLEVHDNGHGFDGSKSHGGSHQGLGNMRARAERLSGHLDVLSDGRTGTTVALKIPVAGSPTDDDGRSTEGGFA